MFLLTHGYVCSKLKAEVRSGERDADGAGSCDTQRTPSGRLSRKANYLNRMYGSKYRDPDNNKLLMGAKQPLGKAYAIVAFMMFGPNLPSELSLHAERHRIFMSAAPYAMSKNDIAFVLGHDNHCDKVIYYHNLLMTGCRVLISVLPNEARDFFQTRVFGNSIRNPDYQLHLGLDMSESVMDQ